MLLTKLISLQDGKNLKKFISKLHLISSIVTVQFISIPLACGSGSIDKTSLEDSFESRVEVKPLGPACQRDHTAQ